MAPFSGGEKARLALALIVFRRPNLLLLDEPTNHLDLEMRHALTLALQDYDGALVVVSHDRHLLRSIADRLWLVADGEIRTFEGDLADYRRWLLERREDGSSQDTARAGPEASGTAPASARDRRRQDAARRQAEKPLRDEVRRLEKDIDRLTRRKEALDQALANPALYGGEDTVRLQELLQEQRRVKRELNEAEEAWISASERLEKAGG